MPHEDGGGRNAVRSRCRAPRVENEGAARHRRMTGVEAARAARHRNTTGGRSLLPLVRSYKKRTPPIDKKDLNAIVVNMVEAVMREQNVPEGMARALVGFALLKNTEGLVASIKNPAGAVQG